MTLERDVLISVLRTAKDGYAEVEEISLDARVPAQIVYGVMKKYSENGTVNLDGKTVTVERDQRLKVAVRAVELGADLEKVCRLLEWKEFEDVSALAFEGAGYSVKKHFRFTCFERRWEIDILALKNPLVASVDCKHWHRGWRRASITKTVESQINRTRALAEASSILREKMSILKWREATFIPIILSLIPSDFKFYENVPIVPILQLRNFLDEAPAYTESLTHFSRRFSD